MAAIFLQKALLPNNKKLTIALMLSVILHILLLLMRFVAPEVFRIKPADSQLEIILVNAKSVAHNTHADVLAQVALNGGGDQEQGRAKSPLPPSLQTDDGDALQQSKKRVAQLEEQQRHLITQAHAAQKQIQEILQKKSHPLPEATLPQNDLLDNAKLIARQFAQIDKQVEDYNKRPRRHFFSPSTSEYKYAQYVEEWRQKVEKIGTLNYPEAARGKLYGQLRLTVYIKSDGTLDAMELDQSSGIPILDRAAQRIVRMGEPYGKFSSEMRKETDILAITRTWIFTNDTLETKAK